MLPVRQNLLLGRWAFPAKMSSTSRPGFSLLLRDRQRHTERQTAGSHTQNAAMQLSLFRQLPCFQPARCPLAPRVLTPKNQLSRCHSSRFSATSSSTTSSRTSMDSKLKDEPRIKNNPNFANHPKDEIAKIANTTSTSRLLCLNDPFNVKREGSMRVIRGNSILLFFLRNQSTNLRGFLRRDPWIDQIFQPVNTRVLRAPTSPELPRYISALNSWNLFMRNVA